jgi:hypothetical protein
VVLAATAVEDPTETVLFIPPDPKTWVWKEGFETTSTEAHVGLKAGGATVTIGVSQAGQITF